MLMDLFTPEDLAVRWKVQPMTLAQWRWTGRGPRFFRVGHHAFYRAQDIEAFEEQKAKQSTSSPEADALLKTILNNKIKDRKTYRRFK